MVGLSGAVLGGAVGGGAVSIVISAIDNFSKTFAKVNVGLLGMGAAITAIGAVGAIGIAKTVKVAGEMESAFTGVRKTVELTEEKFAVLDRQLQDLSTTIPMTYGELAGITEIAGQLGVTGVANLEKFTKTIADISVTTNLTKEQAASDFARLANIMGSNIDVVDRYGAAVVDLGNNFATTEAEIVEMSMRLAGAGKIVGMTESDLFGLATAMTSVGIQAQMGGSAMSRAISEITKSVATGGERLDKFASISGISSEKFKKAWEDDATKALTVFLAGLKRLSDSGGNVFGVLDEIGLGSIRTRDTMLRLSQAGDLVTRAIDTSSVAFKENTALTEEARKRYETWDSQVAMLKNSFSLLMGEMGKTVIPILKDTLIPALKKLVTWFGDLNPAVKKWGVILALGATALALFLGPLIMLIALLPALSAGLAMVTVASAPLWITIGLVAAAIVGLIALIAGVIYIVKHWKDSTNKLVDWLLLALGPIGLVLATIRHWDEIKAIVSRAINAIIDFCVNVKDKIVGLVGEARDWGKNLMHKFATGIKDFAVNAVNNIIDMGKNIKSSIGETLKKAYNWGKDLLKQFADGILSGFKYVEDKIYEILDWVKSKIGFGPEVINDRMAQSWGREMVKNFGKGAESGISSLNSSLNKMFDFNKEINTSINISKNDVMSNLNNSLNKVLGSFQNNIMPETANNTPLVIQSNLYLDGYQISQSVNNIIGEELTTR